MADSEHAERGPDGRWVVTQRIKPAEEQQAPPTPSSDTPTDAESTGAADSVRNAFKYLHYKVSLGYNRAMFSTWSIVPDHPIAVGQLPSPEILQQIGEVQKLTGILSCVEEFELTPVLPALRASGVPNKLLPIDDLGSITVANLYEGSLWLEGVVRQDPAGLVYVHCKAGKGRSVALAMAYLVRYRGLDLFDAWKCIFQVRQQICCNRQKSEMLHDFLWRLEQEERGVQEEGDLGVPGGHKDWVVAVANDFMQLTSAFKSMWNLKQQLTEEIEQENRAKEEKESASSSSTLSGLSGVWRKSKEVMGVGLTRSKRSLPIAIACFEEAEMAYLDCLQAGLAGVWTPPPPPEVAVANAIDRTERLSGTSRQAAGGSQRRLKGRPRPNFGTMFRKLRRRGVRLPLPKEPVQFGVGMVDHRQVFSNSDACFAFVPLSPHLPGHVVVASSREVSRVSQLSQEDFAALWACAYRVAGMLALAAQVTAEGFSFILQDGLAAGQGTSHVHLHIIPRNGAPSSASLPANLSASAPLPMSVVNEEAQRYRDIFSPTPTTPPPPLASLSSSSELPLAPALASLPSSSSTPLGPPSSSLGARPPSPPSAAPTSAARPPPPRPPQSADAATVGSPPSRSPQSGAPPPRPPQSTTAGPPALPSAPTTREPRRPPPATTPSPSQPPTGPRPPPPPSASLHPERPPMVPVPVPAREEDGAENA